MSEILGHDIDGKPLRAGDRVVICGNAWRDKGNICTVVGIEPDQKRYPGELEIIDHDDNDMLFCALPSDLRKLPPQTRPQTRIMGRDSQAGVEAGRSRGMNDRELLEAAARAAGYDIRPHPDGTNRLERRVLFGCSGYYNNWNPLKSDAAAFQLVVDLDLMVDSVSGLDSYRAKPRCGHRWFCESGKDAATFPGRAALRRAIVRAAAALAPSTADC